jgi:hypothetical protein
MTAKNDCTAQKIRHQNLQKIGHIQLQTAAGRGEKVNNRKNSCGTQTLEIERLQGARRHCREMQKAEQTFWHGPCFINSQKDKEFCSDLFQLDNVRRLLYHYLGGASYPKPDKSTASFAGADSVIATRKVFIIELGEKNEYKSNCNGRDASQQVPRESIRMLRRLPVHGRLCPWNHCGITFSHEYPVPDVDSNVGIHRNGHTARNVYRKFVRRFYHRPYRT